MDSQDRPANPGQYRQRLAILLACAAVLYFSTIALNSFWFDEVCTALAGRMPFAGMLRDRATWGHVPLFFALSWAWQQVAGDGELALRFFPVLLGLADAALLFLIIEKMAGPRAGFWAALLLLANPDYLSTVQTARMYSLLLLLALCSVYLIVRWESAPGRGHAAGLAVLLVLLVYVHYSALFVWGAVLLYLAARRRPVWKLAVPGLFAILVLAPWFLYASGLIEPERRLRWLRGYTLFDTLSLPVRLSGTIQSFSMDSISGGRIAAPAIVSLVTAILIAWALFHARKSGRIFVFLLIVPIAGATVAALFGAPSLLRVVRYFVVSLCAQSAVFAIGLAGESEPHPRARFAALLLLLALNGGGLFAYFFDAGGYFAYQKFPWRESAKLVCGKRAPTEQIYFAGGHDEKTFNYYCPTVRPRAYRLMERLPESLRRGAVSWGNADLLRAFALSPATTGVWIYIPDPDELVPEDFRFIQIMEELLPGKATVDAPGGRLLHLKRKADGGASPGRSGADSSRRRSPPPSGPV